MTRMKYFGDAEQALADFSDDLDKLATRVMELERSETFSPAGELEHRVALLERELGEVKGALVRMMSALITELDR